MYYLPVQVLRSLLYNTKVLDHRYFGYLYIHAAVEQFLSIEMKFQIQVLHSSPWYGFLRHEWVDGWQLKIHRVSGQHNILQYIHQTTHTVIDTHITHPAILQFFVIIQLITIIYSIDSIIYTVENSI